MTRIKIDIKQRYEEFEDLQDEMYLRYHVHPTHIPKNLRPSDRDYDGDWGRLGNSGGHWVNGMPPGMKQ